MAKPVKREELLAMEATLMDKIDAERRYWQVNEVKCDAVRTAKTYEEFSERAAAAHLRPLEKGDAIGRGARGWNPVATSHAATGDM